MSQVEFGLNQASNHTIKDKETYPACLPFCTHATLQMECNSRTNEELQKTHEKGIQSTRRSLQNLGKVVLTMDNNKNNKAEFLTSLK